MLRRAHFARTPNYYATNQEPLKCRSFGERCPRSDNTTSIRLRNLNFNKAYLYVPLIFPWNLRLSQSSYCSFGSHGFLHKVRWAGERLLDQLLRAWQLCCLGLPRCRSHLLFCEMLTGKNAYAKWAMPWLLWLPQIGVRETVANFKFSCGCCHCSFAQLLCTSGETKARTPFSGASYLGFRSSGLNAPRCGTHTMHLSTNTKIENGRTTDRQTNLLIGHQHSRQTQLCRGIFNHVRWRSLSLQSRIKGLQFGLGFSSFPQFYWKRT